MQIRNLFKISIWYHILVIMYVYISVQIIA